MNYTAPTIRGRSVWAMDEQGESVCVYTGDGFLKVYEQIRDVGTMQSFTLKSRPNPINNHADPQYGIGYSSSDDMLIPFGVLGKSCVQTIFDQMCACHELLSAMPTHPHRFGDLVKVVAHYETNTEKEACGGTQTIHGDVVVKAIEFARRATQ